MSASNNTQHPLEVYRDESTKHFQCAFPDCHWHNKMRWRVVDHTLSAHHNVRPYPCAALGCDSGYASKQRLQDHIQRAHSRREHKHLLRQVSLKRFFSLHSRVEVSYGKPGRTSTTSPHDESPQPNEHDNVKPVICPETDAEYREKMYWALFGKDYPDFGNSFETPLPCHTDLYHQPHISPRQQCPYPNQAEAEAVTTHRGLPTTEDSFETDLRELLIAENAREEAVHWDMGQCWDSVSMRWIPVTTNALPRTVGPTTQVAMQPKYTFGCQKPQSTMFSSGHIDHRAVTDMRDPGFLPVHTGSADVDMLDAYVDGSATNLRFYTQEEYQCHLACQDVEMQEPEIGFE